MRVSTGKFIFVAFVDFKADFARGLAFKLKYQTQVSKEVIGKGVTP